MKYFSLNKIELNIHKTYLATEPTAPIKPVLSKITNTSAVATWKPVVGAASYMISMSSVADETVHQLTSDVVSIVLDNLKPGTTYSLTVQAKGTLDRNSAPSAKSLFHTGEKNLFIFHFLRVLQIIFSIKITKHTILSVYMQL